jgi:signal transduction histidine kinase
MSGTAELGDTAGLGLPPFIAALAAAPISIMVFDAMGVVRYVNPEVLRQLGLPPETNLAGRTHVDIAQLCAFRGFYGPGDPEVLAAGALAVDRTKPSRRTLRCHDGRWFDLASQPLEDGGHVTYGTDVTAHRRGEAEALERNRLLEMVIHHQHAGVGVFDAGQRLLKHNSAYEQVLGLPIGSLRAGMTLLELHGLIASQYGFSPELAAASAARRMIDRGQPYDEVRQLPDGRALRNISTPLPTGGFLVSVEDVTSLQRLENEAGHRAATMRGVLAALPDGICVYDANQRLTMVNDAYQQILRGAELKIGDHLLAICRQREAAGEYPPGITAEDIYRRQFQFGPPRLRQRADGTVLSIRNAPLPDGGHINVVADVTALHQAEAEARHRATLLQAMLDNMRHGVVLFDSDARLVASNDLAVRMSGLEPGHLRPGADLNSLRDLQLSRGEFGTGAAAAAQVAVRKAMRPDERDRYTRTRADGTMIEVCTDPTPDGGFVRTYTDITEDRRIRAALEDARRVAEEASSTKTRFLATMSHELRTPLNAVIGFSETLLAEETLTAQGTEFAGAILEAGRHLLSLIDDILQVAQVAGAEPAVHTRLLFLPSVLESALRLVRKTAEANGVALVLEPLPEALPRAMAEERRLRQILLNLLSNAVKFTPGGGGVFLSATALADGRVEITVRDTGIGIEPADLARAFEPFVQLEAAHDRRYGGSGLGLYLARSFSQALGAELVLESTRGQGTIARLRLAAANAENA